MNLEIKKFFGYTLDQYLELTYYEVEVLKNKAIKLKEEMAKAYEKLSNKANTTNIKPEAYSMIYDKQSSLLNGED